MKVRLVFIIACILLLSSCKLNTDKIADNCSNLTFEELKKQNTISEDCKKAIQDLLPGFQSNLETNLVKTGVKLSLDVDTFSFALSDLNGIPGTFDTSKIKISSWQENIEKDITKNISWVKSNVKYSLGIIIDYSGSMSNEDINNAYSILNDFIGINELSDNCEANHIVFSASVTEKSKFISGKENLKSMLIKDTSYLRESTSLYDAMGYGIKSLSERKRPGKILVVFTDGEENSSEMYDVNKIIELANDNNITIILIGSLFSDIDAFKIISYKTKGIYLYNKNISDLAGPLIKAGKIIAASSSFKLDHNFVGDSIVVSYGGKSIAYKIK